MLENDGKKSVEHFFWGGPYVTFKINKISENKFQSFKYGTSNTKFQNIFLENVIITMWLTLTRKKI